MQAQGGSSCAASLKHFCTTRSPFFTPVKYWLFQPLKKYRWVPLSCCTLNSLGLCKEQLLIKGGWAQRDQSSAPSRVKVPLYQCKRTLKQGSVSHTEWIHTFFTILPWNSGSVWLVGCLFSGKLGVFFKERRYPTLLCEYKRRIYKFARGGCCSLSRVDPLHGFIFPKAGRMCCVTVTLSSCNYRRSKSNTLHLREI